MNGFFNIKSMHVKGTDQNTPLKKKTAHTPREILATVLLYTTFSNYLINNYYKKIFKILEKVTYTITVSS